MVVLIVWGGVRCSCAGICGCSDKCDGMLAWFTHPPTCCPHDPADAICASSSSFIHAVLPLAIDVGTMRQGILVRFIQTTAETERGCWVRVGLELGWQQQYYDQ